MMVRPDEDLWIEMLSIKVFIIYYYIYNLFRTPNQLGTYVTNVYNDNFTKVKYFSL